MKRFCAMAAPVLPAGLPGLAADNPAGFAAMGCEEAFGCIPGKSCAEARALHARAGQGDPEAAMALGLRLMRGDGVAPDDLAAMRWFEKAAGKGMKAVYLPLAMARLETGDFTAARKWLGAAVCDTGAMEENDNFRLAFGLDEAWLDDMEEGNGMDRDAVSGDRRESAAKRLRWLEREARRGNGAAVAGVARLYEAGMGVAGDGERSAMWRRRAAGANPCRNAAGDDSLAGEAGAACLRMSGTPGISCMPDREIP